MSGVNQAATHTDGLQKQQCTVPVSTLISPDNDKDPCVSYCLGRDPLAEHSLKCIFTLSLISLSEWLHYTSPDVF